MAANPSPRRRHYHSRGPNRPPAAGPHPDRVAFLTGPAPAAMWFHTKDIIRLAMEEFTMHMALPIGRNAAHWALSMAGRITPRPRSAQMSLASAGALHKSTRAAAPLPLLVRRDERDGGGGAAAAAGVRGEAAQRVGAGRPRATVGGQVWFPGYGRQASRVYGLWSTVVSVPGYASRAARGPPPLSETTPQAGRPCVRRRSPTGGDRRSAARYPQARSTRRAPPSPPLHPFL